MSKPILYGPAYSTYTRSARLAMEEKGVDYDLVEVDFLQGPMPAEQIERHPFARVPAFEHDGFEHNVQGLRIVDRLERRYPAFPGLNLSFEIREAILKHGPTGPDARTEEFSPPRKPALETVVVDLADSTAYNHHDLDDGLRAEILDLDDLCANVRLVDECREAARASCGATPRRGDVRLAHARGRLARGLVPVHDVAAVPVSTGRARGGRGAGVRPGGGRGARGRELGLPVGVGVSRSALA